MPHARLAAALALTLGCATPGVPSPTPSPEPPAPPAAPPAPGASPAPAPPAAPAAPPSPAGGLAELLARELPELGTQRLPWRGRRLAVEAAGPVALEEHPEGTSLSVPLGTESPLLCDMRREPSAAGMLLSRLGRGEGRTLLQSHVVDVVAIREQPALFMEVLARTGQAAVEHRKLAVVRTAEGILVCMHGEPGYVQTFQRVVTRLADALLQAGPRTTSRYVELQRVTLGDMPVGFERREAHGPRGSQLTLDATLVLPLEGGDFHTVDVVVTQQADATGRLEALRHGRLDNGERVSGLTLQRQAGHRYAYEGTHGRQPVRGEFDTREGLASEALEAQRLRQALLTGREQALRLQVYEPRLDPAGPTEVVFTRDPARGPRAVLYTQGARTHRALLDAHGRLEALEPVDAELPLTHTRLLVRGTP